MWFAVFFLIGSVKAQPVKREWPSPPGCIQLYDSLFIDQTEIFNSHYLEFIYTVKRDSGNDFFNKMLPDTTVWDEFDSTGVAKAYYLRSPDLRFYPVVGVSFEQASAFCAWRSLAVTRSWREKNSDPDQQVEFNFRLPNEVEWIAAASANLDTAVYSYGLKEYVIRSTLLDDSKYYWQQIKNKGDMTFSEFEYIFNRHRRYGREPFFNCLKNFFNYFQYGAMQPLSTIDQSNSMGIFKERLVYNYRSKANDYGMSAAIGNVAEMIDKKGLAKGGSWAHTLESCKISKWQYYKRPTAWLGFRCVCVVRVLN